MLSFVSSSQSLHIPNLNKSCKISSKGDIILIYFSFIFLSAFLIKKVKEPSRDISLPMYGYLDISYQLKCDIFYITI